MSTGNVPKCMGTTFFTLKQPNRLRGFVRAHGEVIADGQECQLRLIQLLNQRHVGEDVGVSREVDATVVLECQNIAGRFAAIDDLAVVEDAAAVNGVRHGQLDEAEIHESRPCSCRPCCLTPFDSSQ